MDVPGQRHVERPQTESDAQLRGRQLGDFVLRECIGEGAFAAVYRSDQPLLGREAVVKVLHQRLRDSDIVFQRFMREARLASRLDHPYAAHVYAFGVEPDDGIAWIAMEFVHGTSLEHWLAERGPLPLEMVVSFFEQVAEVVQNAHDHGIVHRDLKPSNVMMIEYADKMFPKLLDFGIAKLVDEAAQLEQLGSPVGLDDEGLLTPSDSGNHHLTQANATLGSPPYMSPEQWTDPLSVGPRSDLYSLAIMAYEALTGQQPFVGATIAAIGERHCNAPVPAVGDRFPAALDRVFQRALAKRPEDRPASALAFARELRAAVHPHLDVETSGLRPIAQARPPGRRRLWLGAAALGIATTGGLAVHTVARVSREAPAAELARPGASDGDGSILSQGPHDPSTGGDPRGAPAPLVPATTLPVVAPGERPAAATELRATVVVEIESQPRGADVFRLPSETKVGSTPWRSELPSEAGVQMFLIRKPGFIDKRVELDLRTGGKRSVKLAHVVSRPQVSRPAAPPPPPPPPPEQTRRRGEPVDPFGTPRRR